MKLIIDGDIVLYKGACTAQTSWYKILYDDGTSEEVKTKTEARKVAHLSGKTGQVKMITAYKSPALACYYTKIVMDAILNYYPGMEYVVVLTDPAGYNYRYDAGQTVAYKSGRPAKPKHLAACRDYVIKKYNTVLASDCEADDLCAILQTEAKADNCILAHIDKDLDQLPGIHYNINTQEEYIVTPLDGLKNLYAQVILGDNVDSIPGLKHWCRTRSCGPVRVAGLLAPCENEQQLYDVIKKHVLSYALEKKEYKELYEERFTEMYNLVYLARTRKELEEMLTRYAKKDSTKD